MTRFDAYCQTALLDRARRHLLRTPRPVSASRPGYVTSDGADLVDLSSNDYLGLAHHPVVRERAALWAQRHGAGARASRLVTGTLDLHLRIEARLAAFKGCEAAVLFASGWQANASVLPALAALALETTGSPLRVYADRLNHASLHHGVAAAGLRQVRFGHNDLGHLETLLARDAHRPGLRLIATESVFSMDGDRADLPALRALADRFDAFLYVDEAHATGVLGPGGRGLAAGVGVDLVMGTFSKAFGAMGAYVAGSKPLCAWLANVASGFVFSTAPPPAVLGAVDAGLDLIPTMDAERARLHRHGARVRQAARDAGLSTGGSSTQIVPIILRDNEPTLAAADRMRADGMMVTAIRPPTVPRGQARLRLALSAAHDEHAIERLCAVLPALLDTAS